MNAYDIGYTIGALARIAFFAAVFLIILFAGKSGRVAPRYDERQTAARGALYKTGFYTLVIYLLLYAAFDKIGVEWSTGAPVGILTGIFLSVTVFAITAIRKDAYFGFNEKTHKSILLLSLIAALNLFTGIMPILSGETVLFENGLFGTAELSFFVTACFIVILITLIIHKKNAIVAEEEEEI